MEDKIVLRNMGIAIGTIALVAVMLITISTLLGNAIG
tara:strand:+ start:719 stop:829 length:111 start_codon:yes stop_codon:yes gene_type:complete